MSSSSWLVPAVLAVLAAGCWGERAPAETVPPPSLVAMERPAQPWPATTRGHLRRREPDRCAKVIGHVFDLARQDITNTMLTTAMLDEFQDSAIEGCHETEWSEESLSCYEDTTSLSEMGECFRSMAAEQKEDFERRLMDVQRRHRPMPSPPPPPPPPAP